jgi:hypothetical protein
MRRGFLVLACLIPLTLLDCKKKGSEDGLTYAQAKEALDEATLATEASTLLDGSVEISTTFTIGQAVEAAAQQIRDFIGSQLPCAELTLTGATLTVDYGKKPGNCTFKGHTYSGSHSITVARNGDGDVEVDHTWTDLTNGKVKVSGTAEVTWSLSAKTRRVVHSLTWTRVSSGRTAVGSGDRTQTVLEGGLIEGIRVDGSREWQGAAGTWDLAIDGVEMRWVDAVPQAGAYVLRTPKDKSLTMSFLRVDETTIKVTIESDGKKFDFNVKTLV